MITWETYINQSHMISFVVPLFFLPLLAMAANTSLSYIPTDYILLDCGSSSNTTSPDGRWWGGDSGSIFSSSNIMSASFESTASRQGPVVDQVPYMTARIFKSQFTYVFPVSPGPKFVRLYFYPATYSGLQESDFLTVTSGVYTLMSNFSASLTVAATEPQAASVIKEFCIHVGENQTLNITFSPSPSFYAFVNGIEVCSIPNNLYLRGNQAPIPLVASNYQFYLYNNTVLETFFRLNVGGSSIAGERDTGMFRSWQDDVHYIFSAATGTAPHWDLPIRYTPETPPYTAPTAVYSSARTMGPTSSINLNYNLTWIFPVDSGFCYLIRLHFCENPEDIRRVNEVVFNIFINNQTAQESADVVAWSGDSGIPVYQDYVVYIKPSGSRGKQDLWLALHPEMASKPLFADAILNGLEIFKLNQSDGNLAGPNPDPVVIRRELQLSKSSSKQLSRLIIMSTPLLGGVFALLVLFFLILRQWKRLSCGESSKTKPSMRKVFSLPKVLCRHFALSELREATKNFDDVLVLGRGGFGNVYKGYIDGGAGDICVAIKRLNSKSKQGAQEFLTEIKMLSNLRHRHLVSLIGYCEQEGEMILVYDYMQNGTLRHHLYGTDNDPLPWKLRLQICIGAARGLDYLHAGAQHPIIHRDVKTTNILLDDRWVAKVSDFGLSKKGPTVMSDDPVITLVKGTFGYMDPEYYKRMKLTQKSDVYSFGVVMLEVLCGRAAVDRSLEYEQMSLANWARACIDNGTADQIVDPYLMGKIAPECFKKFVEIAYQCVLDEGIERPTMGEVVESLEFALQLQVTADATPKEIILCFN